MISKSPTLAQLAVRTAWLTLDAADEPESVFRHLAFAPHTAGLDVDTARWGDLPSP